MIFIEIKKWGDFDMPYTDSLWYNVIHHYDPQMFLQNLMNDFGKTTTRKFTTSSNNQSIGVNIYCGHAEIHILRKFKTFLRTKDFFLANTIPIQFSNESLEFGDNYKKEDA